MTQPYLFPEGIEWVLVNGQVVIERDTHTGARPGRVLYGPGRAIAQQQFTAARPVLTAPIDVTIPKPPTPFVADGKTHLVYELNVTNLGSEDCLLDRVAVSEGGARACRVRGNSLSRSREPAGPGGPARRSQVEGGRRAAGGRLHVGHAPRRCEVGERSAASHHGEARGDAAGADDRCGPCIVGRSSTHDRPTAARRVVGRGQWTVECLRAPADDHLGRWHGENSAALWHRLAAARPDGTSFTGDAKDNKNYLAHGEDALAVADGIVSAIKDGIPENVPGPPHGRCRSRWTPSAATTSS